MKVELWPDPYTKIGLGFSRDLVSHDNVNVSSFSSVLCF